MNPLNTFPTITPVPSPHSRPYTILPAPLSPSSRSISTSRETLMTTFLGGTDMREKPANRRGKISISNGTAKRR